MRRRYKSNLKYPITIACGDIARNRGFEKPSDMRKAKRVRFEDSKMDGATVQASPGGSEATQSPIGDAPKTSEYAYFKKVKNNSVHSHSHALHKEHEQLRGSKTNYLTRDTSSASQKLKTSMQNLNFSVSGERTQPSDHNLLLSPHVREYDKSDQIRSKELTNQIRKRTSLPSGNVTPVGQSLSSSTLDEASGNSENQCRVNGIFSEKRLRLRQWVAHTCSEVEKLHPMGFDLVSSLLSRLITKENDSSKGDDNNNAKSLTFDESLENGCYLSQKRNWNKDLPKSCSGQSSDIVHTEWDSFVSGFPSSYQKGHSHDKSMDPDRHSKRHKSSSHPQHGSAFCLPFESRRSSGSLRSNLENGCYLSQKRNWDKDLPKFCLGRSSDIIHTEWDSFVSGLPSNYKKDSHFHDKFMDPDRHSESHKSSSHSQHGFAFCLPFESHRSSGSFHFKDLDEFSSIIEHETEPCQLLLEWDSELGKDRYKSSTVNHGIEMRICGTFPNSWDADQLRIMDTVLETNMWSSSLLPNCYLEPNALLNHSSEGGLMQNFEPNFDDLKCAMAVAEQFSRALPCNPKCITLAEDKHGEKILSNSSIIFPYGDQDWLTKKVWDGKPLSEPWWKCLSAAEDDPSVWHIPENNKNIYSVSRLKETLGEETFRPLYEGAFNRCFMSPVLQSSLSLDTFINRPLLLNHGSPEQELYLEDYGNKLGYRKVL